MSATKLLESLLDESVSILAKFTRSAARKNERNRFVVFQLENPQYFVDLCAWDHGFGFDILILECQTGAEVWSEAGHCQNEVQFRSRFQRFANWIEANASDVT